MKINSQLEEKTPTCICLCSRRLSQELTTSEEIPEQKKTGLRSSATHRNVQFSYSKCSSPTEKEPLEACKEGCRHTTHSHAAQHSALAFLQTNCKTLLFCQPGRVSSSAGGVVLPPAGILARCYPESEKLGEEARLSPSCWLWGVSKQ